MGCGTRKATLRSRSYKSWHEHLSSAAPKRWRFFLLIALLGNNCNSRLGDFGIKPKYGNAL